MEREQIIKALECCAIGDCEPCAYRKLIICRDRMAEDALSLIKELTEENERLRKLMSTSSLQGAIVGSLQVAVNELTTDKERVEKLLDDKCDRCIERERANTVREMHFEIQQRCIKGGIYPAFVGCTVDKVAYDMTGDEFYVSKFRMEDTNES